MDAKEWPIRDDDAQRILAKALSGFSNADGGILVIGVEARSAGKGDPDVIQTLKPVADAVSVKSRIENLVGNLVEPPLPGIRYASDEPLWRMSPGRSDSGMDESHHARAALQKKWQELIRQQQQSKLSVSAFCRQHGFSDQAFYNWRKRLAADEPVRFALVDASPIGSRPVRAAGTDSGLRRPAPHCARHRCRDLASRAERAAGTLMMHLPASVRVYLCASACDMRKSFDGLHALVTQSMQLDAFGGHLFVFANRRRDRIKILYWDRDGFAVWAKRLEEGTYAMPFGGSDVIAAEKRHEITAAELGALLSGIDLSHAKRRKRYVRQVSEAA